MLFRPRRPASYISRDNVLLSSNSHSGLFGFTFFSDGENVFCIPLARFVQVQKQTPVSAWTPSRSPQIYCGNIVSSQHAVFLLMAYSEDLVVLMLRVELWQECAVMCRGRLYLAVCLGGGLWLLNSGAFGYGRTLSFWIDEISLRSSIWGPWIHYTCIQSAQFNPVIKCHPLITRGEKYHTEALSCLLWEFVVERESY